MIPASEIVRLIAEHRLVILGLDGQPADIQPCSLDLKLFRILRKSIQVANLVFDPARKQQAFDRLPTEQLDMLNSSNTVKCYLLQPTEMILGCTVESVGLGAGVCGALHMKSTYARMGLHMGGDGGPVHPGFCGQLTLALTNMGQLPIALRPGLPICQMTFTSTALEPDGMLYGEGSHYQNSEGPIPPRALRD